VKLYDQASSLFWLLASISVITESLRLGVGTLHNPGMGFMTFGASGLLAILSLGVFIRASLQRETVKREPLFSGGTWRQVLCVLLALSVYSSAMPVLGYLISTFVLMTVLFWLLEKKKPGLVFASALLSTLITYFVFSKWLNCQFPDGLFGL
jgi:putative tricarboxylic transport membrane protein